MIKKIDFRHIFFFKIVVLIIFLASTVKYTTFIYDFGIYICVPIGACLLLINIINKNIIIRKIDFLIVAFCLFYCITMILNYQNDIIKQGFVLLCCLMYFFLFFSGDVLTKEMLKKQNDIILLVILVYTFLCTVISFIKTFLDVKNGSFESFNLHGGHLFQLIGIYTGISTCAIIAGLSAIISLCFIIRKGKKGAFFIFNILNFIIQDIAVTLTYTSAGVVAFGFTLFLGITYYFINQFRCKKIVAIVLIVIMSFAFVAINYYLMDKVSQSFVENISEQISSTIENPEDNPHIVIAADEALSGLFNSNGRLQIWISAINQWLEKPLFGQGYGNFYYSFEVNNQDNEQLIEYTNTHNGYLELLLSCGAMGFGTVMIFGGYYIVKLIVCYLNNKLNLEEIATFLIIIYACIYAMINELFILDRSISTFLLVSFLGMARKIDIDKRL